MRLFLTMLAVMTATCCDTLNAAGTFTPLATPNAPMVGMSWNGEYAVSNAFSFSGLTCYRWIRGTGVEESLDHFICTDVNASGTAAGYVNLDDAGAEFLPAVFGIGASEPETLPLPDGYERAQALALSDDGNTVVGQAAVNVPFGTHAFVWTRGGGSSLLPVSADAGNSVAQAISPDGTLIAGWELSTENEPRAVIWQDGVGIYPTNDAGQFLGAATAISANGEFVVGDGYITESGQSVAWRWSASSGEAIPLEGLFFAHSVTDDGRVITGDTGFLANRLLLVWTEGEGAATITDYVAAKGIARPYGWVILAGQFMGVSNDGATIAGCCGFETSDFSLRGFVITGLNDAPDSILRDGFDGPPAPNPVQDSGFEATTQSGGSNPFWQGLDGNPDAVGPPGEDATNFYSATNGGIATHRGLWSVFFGGWENGLSETQEFSQSVTLPTGGPLFLKFWRLAAVLPDAPGMLSVSVDGEEVQTTDLSLLAEAEGDFVQQSVEISAYADGAAHVVRIAYAYEPGANFEDGRIFIDDVTIEAHDSASIP